MNYISILYNYFNGISKSQVTESIIKISMNEGALRKSQF